MAAAMVRQHSGQRFRSGRFRGRHGSGEENIQLDFTKEPSENVKEILTYVIKQKAFSKAKKLGYLNVFVKLIGKCGDTAKLGYTLREIFICLSVNLLHAPKEVRAATLRVIKHLISDETALGVLLSLHIDYFIARSIDLCLDNEIERVHAQKLMRKLTSTTPNRIPSSLVFPLVAIGNDGTTERDRMVRASMALMCELTYHNPDLVAHCGGISMLLRKILDCHQYPRINESLVSTILHLVNKPSTRHFIQANTDLEQLIAPLTDCHFSYSGETTEVTSEEKESRFAASKMALLSVMRSWPGIIRFCKPDGTGLQSLVGILYLPFTDIRQAIMDLVFDLFHLTVPVWTTDFTEALISIDPSKMVEDWRLTDGFVAHEGKCVLAHMAKIRPNLVESHQALLLSAWIGAGILDALVEVIITTDNELFVRAVVLLGNLLHLANQLLPPECSHHSHYLPSLMALASSFDIPNTQRHQASIAVSYLDRVHSLKKRGAIPCSLYLDQQIKLSGCYKDRPQSFNMQKNKLLDIHIRKRAGSSEEFCLQTLKDTMVVATKENKNWNWDLVDYVLKWPDDRMKKLEDQTYQRFIRRLVYFFKPTNHLFSRMESDHEQEQQIASVGCQLVDFLVRCEQEEGLRMLMDLLTDVALCLSEVALQRIAPESVLSAVNVISTMSHYYFLFIGRISQISVGERFLEKAGIFQYLLDIVSSAPQDSYVKLITSSLYYGKDGNSRTVLSKALCAAPESGRLYCTKLMRVLLRAKVPGFQHWGIEMLVSQLYDQSRGVAMTALSILDEACEVKENLESLIKMKPSFLHLGEKGVMMLCRYMSTSEGYRFLTEANYTMNELKKWHTSFNIRYVLVVEEMLNEALTTYEKTFEGSYTRRSSKKRYVLVVEEMLNEALTTYEKTYEGSYTRRSSKKRQNKDVFVPTHLYGQLVQHKEGFHLLRQQTYIEDYFQLVRCPDMKTEEQLLQLKTALWAIGHISTSSWGISWLQEEKIVPEVIRLAEESPVYSIRGTSFFILCLISSTREGAEVLSQYGWESRWNTRAEKWPLVEDRSLLLADSMEDVRSNVGFSFGGAKIDLGSPTSNLDFIAEENFQSGKFVFKPQKNYGSGCDEDSDNESGIVISSLGLKGKSHLNSPEHLRQGARQKSQTFPFESHADNKRMFNLPVRSQTVKVASNREKTRSVENVGASRDLQRISSSNRSRSMHIVSSKHDSSKTLSVIANQSISNEQVSVVNKTVELKDSNENEIIVHCKPSEPDRSSNDNELHKQESVKNVSDKQMSDSKQKSDILEVYEPKDEMDSSIKEEISDILTEANDEVEGSIKETKDEAKDETDSGILRKPEVVNQESESNKHVNEANETSEIPHEAMDETDSSLPQNPELVFQRHDSDKQMSSSEHTSDKQNDAKDEIDSGLHQKTEVVNQGHDVPDSQLQASNVAKISLETGPTIKISVTDTDKLQTQSSLDVEELSNGVNIKSNVCDNDNSAVPSHSESTSKLESTDCEIKSGEHETSSKDSVSVMKRSVSLKDERSSSSESSRTTKSRTDSFNTDSVTSGVGSYDSGHHGGVSEFPSLSPIASTNSLDMSDVQMRKKDNQDSVDFIHPSSVLRRQSNLSRVPSIRRQSGMGIQPSSKYFDFSENAIMYTTARDAIGYATLRSLMKTRAISSDVESDYGLSNLYDTGSVSSRRPSIDSTDTTVHRPQSLLLRNFSGVSLSELDPGTGGLLPQKASLYQQRPHTGQAEFLGISLPVDIHMMFEEGEEYPGGSMIGVSRQASTMDHPSGDSNSAFTDSLTVRFTEVAERRARLDSMNYDPIPTPLSSRHNKAICVKCSLDKDRTTTEQTEEIDSLQTRVDVLKPTKDTTRSRTGSMNEQTPETSSSQASTASESSSKKLTLDTPLGRTFVRKEILRFVINLSSSVGVKGAEQGLLSLKQKFPQAFQDLCFYSEVSYLLGACSFRLTARRFIQELFEEMDTSRLLEEAREILGVDETIDKAVVNNSLIEDYDPFNDNF